MAVSGEKKNIWFMTAPPTVLSLPSAQQIIAWGLYALGYGDDPGPDVSRSTLRKAHAGEPIPEKWDDLVASMFRRLGVKSLPEDRRATAEALLRRWDLMIGELPQARELSLAERLHFPLVCSILEVGIRLGALAASVALATRTPIEKRLWIVEPLDKRFFGNVVQALLAHHWPDKTIEDLKGIVEVGIKDEEKKVLDWRTIERWYGGETEVPNINSLESLAELLGKGAEAMLRAARLAAVLRKDLSEWIGADAMSEWAGVVADVGRVTAQLLSDPSEVASLLRQICEDLEAPHGEAFYAKLRLFLPNDAKERSRSELISVLAAAAGCVEHDGNISNPIARWFIGCGILVVYPQLEARAWSVFGGNSLGYLAMKNVASFIRHEWTFRTLMKAIAHGGALSLARADGTPVERQISGAMQEIAQRWEATSLRFRWVDGDDDPTLDADIMAVLFNLLEPEGFMGADRSASLSFDLLGMMFDPAAEGMLSDDQVRASLPLSLGRARRLLRAGDWESAMRWLPDFRVLRPPLSQVAITGLLATDAEIAHYALNQPRKLRGLYRLIPAGSERDQARGVLLENAQLVERLVEQMLHIGEAPEASQARLETLVNVLPVAIRVMLLCEEVEALQGGLNLEAVGQLIEQLKQCLELHASHGRGWALLALWYGIHEQRKEEEHAEKQATHFGAGHVLEDEWTRLRDDLCYADDADGTAV